MWLVGGWVGWWVGWLVNLVKSPIYIDLSVINCLCIIQGEESSNTRLYFAENGSKSLGYILCFLQKYDDEVTDEQRLAELATMDKKTFADVFDHTVEINTNQQPKEPPQVASHNAAQISEEPRLGGEGGHQNGDAHPVTNDSKNMTGESPVDAVQTTRM